MKKLVVLSGAGMSADSGIPTFRGEDGLWEGHDVMEVASPQGWAANKELVLDFYNFRRKKVLEVEPNQGHIELVRLEKHFHTQIITQNIDDLHERAGSSNVIHLHGEILKSRSEINESLVYPCTEDIRLGDLAEDGAQLRPDIVWFGEMVPKMEEAALHCQDADILVIVGTSMQVYPAAGLKEFAPTNCPIYALDPSQVEYSGRAADFVIQDRASKGMSALVDRIISDHG